MDPSNQLFGHYLRYRMDMQKRMAEQHNGQPEVKKVSGIGAAIGKLLRNMVSYQKYPATYKEPELSPDWSKKQLEQQAYHCLHCLHCPEGALAESSTPAFYAGACEAIRLATGEPTRATARLACPSSETGV